MPNVKPPYIEAEISPDQLPGGFDYYAAGHVHERFLEKFKDGYFAYSGCTETADYREAKYRKGFLHVKVNEKGEVNPESMELSSTRRFIIFEQDFQAWHPQKSRSAAQLVKEAIWKEQS